MIGVLMRRGDGVPVVFVGADRTPTVLHRVSPNDPSLAEHQIQQLVFDHPQVLPVRELDETCAPAVAVARELGTTAGPVDVLFVSPTGGITIVEAKLWRNPEARREVLGQIIDYATALSSWSYGQLDAACAAASGRSLYELVSTSGQDGLSDGEAGFIDAVSRNLAHGRFLLLVVGDGIREDVQRMASYIQGAPRLQFHLALVELRIHTSSDNQLRVVVPSVVAKTAEITRAVVTVEVAEQARIAVDVSVPVDDTPAARRTLTTEQFYARMGEITSPETVAFTRRILDTYGRDPRYTIEPRAASHVLKIRNPAGPRDFTVLVLRTDGRVHPGWLSGQCRAVGIAPEVAFRFVADLSTIFAIPIHDTYADSLASSASPQVVKRTWDAVQARIDELTSEILDQLT